jgi:hypothetical protein
MGRKLGGGFPDSNDARGKRERERERRPPMTRSALSKAGDKVRKVEYVHTYIYIVYIYIYMYV